MAEVLSVSGSVTVPRGSWIGDGPVTKDWSPLERSTVEHKDYARDIGLAKAEKVRGGSEAIMLTAIRRE